MKSQLEFISEKLREHDQRFDSIDQRFETNDRRFESIDQRFEIQSQEFHDFRILQEEFGAKLNMVLDITIQTHQRLIRFDETRQVVDSHEHRIFALETAAKELLKKDRCNTDR